MKHTRTTCDNCGGSNMGGPRFRQNLERDKFNEDVVFDIKASSRYHGHVIGELDYCYDCKEDLIIKWAESIKTQKAKEESSKIG